MVESAISNIDRSTRSRERSPDMTCGRFAAMFPDGVSGNIFFTIAGVILDKKSPPDAAASAVTGAALASASLTSETLVRSAANWTAMLDGAGCPPALGLWDFGIRLEARPSRASVPE